VKNEAPLRPSAQPRVLVVVLTWNGRDDTLGCVQSIVELRYEPFGVLVVDNASSDGTHDAVRERFGERVEVLRNDANLLFAGGMNVGLARAVRDGYDYALILNNDVVLDPGMLDALVDTAAQDATIAAVGPKIFYADPSDTLWFAGGELQLWRGWSRHRGIRQRDRGQFDTSGDVNYLTGCAMLMRCKALTDVGLLDTGFAMYAEDADWCFRARARGHRLVYAPAARVWHRVSASAGQRSWYKMRHRLASQVRFLARHARWYHWLTIPFFTLLEAVRVGWVVVRRRA
jgi:GT2 family glycosyltransferase